MYYKYSLVNYYRDKYLITNKFYNLSKYTTKFKFKTV